MVAVLPVGESTPMKRCSSNPSTRKSECSPSSRCSLVLTHCYSPFFVGSVSLSHKRLTQQKKQRERERKELDALGRRHLANVRVVQRNVVYVVGIGPRFAKEEVSGTYFSPEAT